MVEIFLDGCVCWQITLPTSATIKIELFPWWEETLQLHGEHHIAIHFELACQKGVHAIQFAFGDGKPVFTTDGEGDIWLLNATRDNLALSIVDFEGPYSRLVSCNIPLEGFVHARCSRRIKNAGHLFEDLGNCHGCFLLNPCVECRNCPR